MKKLQKLLVLALVLILVLTSCGNKVKPEPPNEEDKNPWPRTSSFSAAQLAQDIDDFDFNEVTIKPVFWSGLHTFALGFLGEIEGEEAKTYHKSKDFLEYLAHLDTPDEVIILQTTPEPKEAWLILPAPYTEKLIVYDVGSAEILIELKEKAAIVYSDTALDAGFTVEVHLGDEELLYTPENSEEFLKGLRSGAEIYDISPEIIVNNDAYVLNDALFAGTWQGFSLIDHLNMSVLYLEFSPVDFETEETYYNLQAEHQSPDGKIESWLGYAFFRVPIDFAEEGDEMGNRVYFELYRDMDKENWDAADLGRFQLFSKFQYSFWHPNVLYLKLVGNDAFRLNEDRYDYVLWRIYE